MSEWVPYEGPQEGEGWQRVSDGEVRYTNDPPGEVADGYEDVAEDWGTDDGRTMSDEELDIRGTESIETLEETFRHASENGTNADLERAMEMQDFRESGISENLWIGTVNRQNVVAQIYEYDDGENTFEGIEGFKRWMDDHFGFRRDNEIEDYLDQNAYEAHEEKFWRQDSAYHATGPESAAKIIASGRIETRNSTRGTSNTGIGSSVFTSMTAGDWLDVYGAVQFEIDVQAMQEDEYTPIVEPEPAVAEARNEEMLADEMGFFNHRAHIPHDVDPNTAIIYEEIPLKYLSLNAEDKEIDDIETELETLEQRGGISSEAAEEAREWLDQQRESDEEKSKSSPTEKEWIPYEGPQGGEGWQNTEDPDDVRYGLDEPPGEVADGYEDIAEGWGETRSLEDLKADIEDEYPSVDLDMSYGSFFFDDVSDDDLMLGNIEVEEEMRGEGIGSKVMSQITEWADKSDTDIYLQTNQGGDPSEEELIDWYKSFDFETTSLSDDDIPNMRRQANSGDGQEPSSGTDFDPYEDWGQEWEETVTHDMMSEDGDEVVERTADFLEDKTDVETVRFRNLHVEHMEKIGDRLGSLDSEFDLSGIEHFGDFGDLQNNFQTDDVAGYFMTEEDPNAFSYGQQIVARPMSFREPRIVGVDNESWTVTNCRYQTVVHEVAHYLHFQEFKEAEEDPHRAWERYYDRLDSDEEELLEQEVSKYGASNAFEAVAEIATGLMYGKEFSEEVMQIYEQHNGPDVPNLGFEEQPWDEDVDYPATLKEEDENPFLVEAEIVLDTFREWAGVDESSPTEKISTDEWIPYEGPNGGEGWQNANDPEDVRYQEYPPGRIAEGYEEMAEGWGERPEDDENQIIDPENQDEVSEWITDNAFHGQIVEVASKQSGDVAEFEVASIDSGTNGDIKLRPVDDEAQSLARDQKALYLGNSPFAENMRYEIRDSQSFAELGDRQQVNAVNQMVDTGPAYENISRDLRNEFQSHTKENVSQQFRDKELYRRTIQSLFIVRNRADRASLGTTNDVATKMRLGENEDITTINHEFGHAILSSQNIGYRHGDSIDESTVSEEKYRRRPANLSWDFQDLRTDDWGIIDFDFDDDSNFYEPDAYMLQRDDENPPGYDEWKERQEKLFDNIEYFSLFDDKNLDWEFVSDDQTAREKIEKAGRGSAAAIQLRRSEDADYEEQRVVIEDFSRNDEGEISWLNLVKPNGGSWGYGIDDDGNLDSSNGSYLQAIEPDYEHDEDERTVATQEAETTVGKFLGMDDPERLEDKVENLVSAVNRAWYKTARLAEKGEDLEVLSCVPDSPYATTNGHEMFAEFHEMMQNEERENFIGVLEKQPWLTAAYVDLFDPAEPAKEAIRQKDLLQDIGVES